MDETSHLILENGQPQILSYQQMMIQPESVVGTHKEKKNKKDKKKEKDSTNNVRESVP